MPIIMVNQKNIGDQRLKRDMAAAITKGICEVTKLPQERITVAFHDITYADPALERVILQVNWTEGQSDDVKSGVAAEITSGIQSVAGMSDRPVTIIFNDIPHGNLASGGKIVNHR